MPDHMFVCQHCGARLRVGVPVEAGRLIRCPACRAVFRAPAEKSTAPLYALRDNEVNCLDCGTTLESDQPLQPGQLVKCPKCTTIFRLPIIPNQTGSGTSPPATPPGALSSILQLKPAVYAFTPEPAIEAEQIRPWDSLPDAIRMERENKVRSSRQHKRSVIITAAGAAACCALIVVVVLFIFVTRQKEPASATNAPPSSRSIAPRNPAARAAPLRTPVRKSRIEPDIPTATENDGAIPGKSQAIDTEHEAARRGAEHAPADGSRSRLGGAAASTKSAEAMQLTSAVGLVAAPGGYILTAAEAVRDPSATVVRIASREEFLSIQLLAVDEIHNLALLRIRVPNDVQLQPLPLRSEREAEAGDSAIVIDYPGNTSSGDSQAAVVQITGVPDDEDFSPLRFQGTKGSIKAGSVLCDTCGNVVGMITTPDRGSAGSGMALRACALNRYLRDHLDDYRPPPAGSRKKEWAEIINGARGSVVLVLGHK